MNVRSIFMKSAGRGGKQGRKMSGLLLFAMCWRL